MGGTVVYTVYRCLYGLPLAPVLARRIPHPFAGTGRLHTHAGSAYFSQTSSMPCLPYIRYYHPKHPSCKVFGPYSPLFHYFQPACVPLKTGTTPLGCHRTDWRAHLVQAGLCPDGPTEGIRRVPGAACLPLVRQQRTNATMLRMVPVGARRHWQPRCQSRLGGPSTLAQPGGHGQDIQLRVRGEYHKEITSPLKPRRIGTPYVKTSANCRGSRLP